MYSVQYTVYSTVYSVQWTYFHCKVNIYKYVEQNTIVANNKSAKLKVRQELGTFIQEIHCIYLTKGNKDKASKLGGGKGGASDHFLPLTKIRFSGQAKLTGSQICRNVSE